MKRAPLVPRHAGLRRALRAHFVVWLLLLALLGLTTAGSRVDLGAGNAALSVAIALAKATLVLGCYMHLRHAPATLRAVLVAALLALLALAGLGGIDLGTRAPPADHGSHPRTSTTTNSATSVATNVDAQPTHTRALRNIRIHGL